MTTSMTTAEAEDSEIKGSLLMVFRHAPYGRSLAREGLEVALAAGAMGVELRVLFINDGVWQLLAGQQADRLSLKNHLAMTSALPLYGVDELFVDTASLLERNIEPSSLTIPVTLLNEQEVRSLFVKDGHILSF